MKTLYIIRGVPGSGKSTLANKLTENVVEADQFMMVNGEYKWSPNKLHYAHSRCKHTVEDYMIEGRDTIAVANTFIKRKEVQPYLELAKEYGYNVVQKVCKGNYQNVHNVPKETVDRMRNNFQEIVLEESLTVYHGSNADFNTFDSRFIGNENVGEGRQRHGWGFYFALNKDSVTRAYGKRITSRHMDSPSTEKTFIFRGKSYKFGSAMYKILELIQEKGQDKAIEYIKSIRNESNSEKIDKLVNLINNLTEEDKTDIKLVFGQFYKVEIPDFKYFLDEERYYKDWFEVENGKKKENTFMKDAIGKAMKELKIDKSYNYKNRNGVRIYNKISDIFEKKGSKQSYKDTSMFLNKFGIKGVTYHDHNDGRCFVVFNDSDIKIIDKDIKSEDSNELKLNDEILNNEIIEKIKQNPKFIGTVNNPSDELVKLAVDLNPDSIRYVKNPSDNILNYLKNSELKYQKKMEDGFIDMTKKHIDLVNKFGSKVGKSYPNHDSDKFKQPLLSKYCLDWKKKYYGLNESEKQVFREAMNEHHKKQSHHPEYWGSAGGHGRIHVENKMPAEAIIEMCADWCAKATEYGNSPIDFAKDNIGKKWKFDDNQKQLIYKTLNQMWNNVTENVNNFEQEIDEVLRIAGVKDL